MLMAAAGLEIAGLHKTFAGKRVLAGVTLTVAPGETLVLMGESGSGKSVLAKCVLGLLPCDSGSIRMGDLDLIKLKGSGREHFMRGVGVLFQRGALFDSLPVWRNVAFGLIEGQGMAAAEAKAKALRTLALLGLDSEAAEVTPAELSGGMQKRVALARAIVSSPRFLVLDEPTEGLDPIMVDLVSNLVLSTVRNLAATTLAITNNIACARKIATRICIMKQGAVIWSGTPRELDAVQDPYLRKFLREPVKA